eukprot:PhM_4_TR18668/c1_g1_i2/m.19939
MGGCYSSAIASKPIQFQKQLSTVHNFSAVVDQRQQEQLRSPKPIPSPSEIVQLEDTNVASNNSSSCPTPRAVQTLSPRPSLSSQRAHSKSSSCLSSNGSTTGTAAYNPAAHTPTSETSGWATYRCPLVGWAVSHPPRWTSDRWVLRDGRHVVTVLRHPTQPSVSLHVTTEVAARGVSVAEAFCSQVRFVEALPGLCSHHVCVSEWRVDFVSDSGDDVAETEETPALTRSLLSPCGNNDGDDELGLSDSHDIPRAVASSMAIQKNIENIHPARRLAGYRRVLRSSHALFMLEVVFVCPHDLSMFFGPTEVAMASSFVNWTSQEDLS